MIIASAMPTIVEDRRKQVRTPYCTAVTVLLPGSDPDADGSAGFVMIKGWTRNASEEGISFVCPQQVTSQRVFLLLRLPGRDNCFFEAQVFNARPLGDGEWEHSAVFRRLLSET